MWRNQNLFQVIKGVIISVIISLLSVLVFAYLIKAFSLSSSVIKPVNQVIKLVAVTVGALLSVRPPKGFIKGGLVGFFATFFEYLIFGAIAKSFAFGATQALDLLFGLVMGMIVGVICGNLKKSF